MKPSEFLVNTFRNTKGTATVEFAFILPILIFLSFGAYNVGQVLARKNQLNSVINAGVLYAIGVSEDPTQVQNAMNNATNIPGLSTTAQSICRCPDGSAPACDSGTTCSDGSIPAQYVSLSATTSITLVDSKLFTFPSPFTMTAQIRVRVG